MQIDSHPRGLLAARYLRALHMGHCATETDLNGSSEARAVGAAYAASQGWTRGGAIVAALKAGVGSTTDDDLRARHPIGVDLAELVRPLTIVGRLRGMKRVPFHSRLIGMTAGAAAHWIAPGVAVPVSGATFAAPVVLTRTKVAALIVTTDEFLRDSSPIAERAFVADLAGAVAQAIDAAFIDVANTGAGEIPASITSGGESVASTGTMLASIDTDLGGLVDDLLDAGSNLSNAAWVMNPRTAAFLARLRGPGGGFVYPGISVRGGELLGLPVVVSAGVPVSADTSATTQISLIDADGVLLADDDDAELSFARDASIEMDSAPTGNSITPTAASKHIVNTFQTNSVGVLAVRSMNWLPRRTTVSSTLTSVPY